MDKINIIGGSRLEGSVQISGAKNAALPLLVSSLLTEQKCSFQNVPHLEDIRSVCRVLGDLGVEYDLDFDQERATLQAAHITKSEAHYDLVRKMRASFLVLGPLVARHGEARVSLPGGCAIGARPIDFHLAGLKKLGADIVLEGGYAVASARRLIGNRVTFDFPSVGATENLMMAAALAKGETVLENSAREPEIVDLADALRAMGAEVEGDGTETIRIQGKTELNGYSHSVMSDRIEAGTFLAAGFVTQGDVTVQGVRPEWLESVLQKYEEAGAVIDRELNSIRLRSNARPIATDVSTQPFPGFPTDMQAQFMAVMLIADGASVISETVYENRFMHVPELNRLGADIKVSGKNALVRGVDRLVGAPMMATDLRASASLIIGGLAAEGETQVSRIYHLDRGYDHIERKLQSLGAQIERVSDS